MTTYTGTIDCSATRIHICQYCGAPFTYPIEKSFSVSNEYSVESAIKSLSYKRDDFLENYIHDHKCPVCKQFQTSMAYKELSRWCVWRYITVVILQLYLYTLIFKELSFCGLEYYLGLLPFWLELFWQYFKINKYYGKQPEQLFSIDEDALEEYAFQRGFYQNLKLLLLTGFICSFLPLLGLCLVGCALLTYYGILFNLPARFRSQGFPLCYKDVNINLR